MRFIPAWAGNALDRTPGAALRPVHPRVGGERRWQDYTQFTRPVHPRVGGERCPSLGPYHGSAGSSPRGRGTRPECRTRPRFRRFIPAWAGDARPWWAIERSSTGFIPAWAGNATESAPLCLIGTGSSPRRRGTRLGADFGDRDVRFIPGWAGNAYSCRSGRPRESVHPRVGGEHILPPASSRLRYGSSPRGRGTRVR